MSIWSGMFAPRGVAPEIMKRLSDALDQSLDDASVQKRLADLGGTVPGKDERSPAKFETYVKGEIERWSPILKSTAAKTN
jgi:tripartite-type tricarboxylate transporter receptor subunit TctC